MSEGAKTYLGAPATEQAEAVRSGTITAEDLVRAHLEHIERHDGVIGAFQIVRVEAAIEEARALSDHPDLRHLPLAGVPVAIKDNVAVRGEPMRNGTLATSEAPSAEDHEVVARIRAAGGIVIGKTRVPELCTFGATDSAFGITRNPYDLSRSPGGSSGGSGAAVASAMVPLAHGNDGMGSVRIPAGCCGLVGIKPGAGVVPAKIEPTDWYGLSENGALATTVDDAALLLSVMAAQPDLGRPGLPGRLRIAISKKAPSPLLRVDRSFAGAPGAVGGLLAGAGHEVEEATPPYATKHGVAVAMRWFAGVDDDVQLLGSENLERRNRRHAALGRLPKRRGWVGPRGRTAWRSRLQPFFERYDVLITPTLAQIPVRSIEWGKRSWAANFLSNARYAPFPSLWNLAGYPAAAVPAGMHPSGLPLSVQVIAPEGRESLVLEVSKQIETLRPWSRHAPGTAPS